jgi:acyl-CoA reductase-like NAD-dependent aldehyde dehydrogenase
MIQVTDPALATPLYQLVLPSESELDACLERARAAQQQLRLTTPRQRAAAIAKVVHYLASNRERLIDAVATETGRSRTDVFLSDMMQMVEDAEWLAKRAPTILRDRKVPGPLTMLGKTSRIFNEPHGVVLVISPWNLPLQIALLAALTAFAAGNTVIIKPSEATPVRDIWPELFAVDPLLEQAVQVVHGDGATAQGLIARRPDMIAFTGSLRTGRRILAQAADLLIPVVMELGAKDFMIVFDDAELERTVPAAVWGAMHNTGQSCTSVERLYVQRPLLDEFTRRAVSAVENLTLGIHDAGDADVGGMITPAQFELVSRQVEDARTKGATIHCGGAPVAGTAAQYQPTVISGVTPDMEIDRAETFGPILVIYSFDTEDEVIATHNATDFGLSASVWSADMGRAERVARALEVGCVCINDVMITEGNPELPFGGVKFSGFGRAKGEQGLLGFTRAKAVISNPMSKAKEPLWYPYTGQRYSALTGLMDALYLKRGPARWWGLLKALWQLKL